MTEESGRQSNKDVFDLAKDHGLILMEDGSLHDTTLGQALPEHVAPMPKTSEKQVASHLVVNAGGLSELIVRNRKFNWSKETVLSRFDGVEEVSLLGPANAAESIPEGPLAWDHGFVVRALKLMPGATIPDHVRFEEEVLFIQRGNCQISVDGESLELSPGDTFTTPIGSTRKLSNNGPDTCFLYVTRRTNQPKAPEFT